jgi:hypothetical protein
MLGEGERRWLDVAAQPVEDSNFGGGTEDGWPGIVARNGSPADYPTPRRPCIGAERRLHSVTQLPLSLYRAEVRYARMSSSPRPPGRSRFTGSVGSGTHVESRPQSVAKDTWRAGARAGHIRRAAGHWGRPRSL